MTDDGFVDFGDAVRIRAAPETDAAGLAGLSGQVYGLTTPSVTGVEVIGKLKEDYAINVYFDGRAESYWFSADLVELIDHAPGTEIRIDGVSKSWVREPDGSWTEKAQPEPARRWWQFWK